MREAKATIDEPVDDQRAILQHDHDRKDCHGENREQRSSRDDRERFSERLSAGFSMIGGEQ